MLNTCNRLETGMSYAQAVEIIGPEGEEMSRNEATVMYSWTNFCRGALVATFQNDRLVAKGHIILAHSIDDMPINRMAG